MREKLNHQAPSMVHRYGRKCLHCLNKMSKVIPTQLVSISKHCLCVVSVKVGRGDPKGGAALISLELVDGWGDLGHL